MIFTEAAEEILEAIWLVREESGSDTAKLNFLREMPDMHILKELIDAGVIEKCDSTSIRLTEKGVGQASDAIRRHRLAERLLTDILSVKGELMHDTACQFEHHLHKGIDTNICTLLGHPKVCPHGKPIPPGRCCEESARLAPSAIQTLAGLKPNQRGHVAYLSTTDPKQAQMLISMGVIPGTGIMLLAGFPSYLFQVGESQFAVDKKIAGEIYVRLEG